VQGPGGADIQQAYRAGAWQVCGAGAQWSRDPEGLHWGILVQQWPGGPAELGPHGPANLGLQSWGVVGPEGQRAP
jgi:hypothetical protein